MTIASHGTQLNECGREKGAEASSGRWTRTVDHIDMLFAANQKQGSSQSGRVAWNKLGETRNLCVKGLLGSHLPG